MDKDRKLSRRSNIRRDLKWFSIVILLIYVTSFALSLNTFAVFSSEELGTIVSTDSLRSWSLPISPLSQEGSLSLDTARSSVGQTSLRIDGKVYVEHNRLVINYDFGRYVDFTNRGILLAIYPHDPYLLDNTLEKRIIITDSRGRGAVWSYDLSENSRSGLWQDILLIPNDFAGPTTDPANLRNIRRMSFDFQMPLNVTTSFNLDNIRIVNLSPATEVQFQSGIFLNLFVPLGSVGIISSALLRSDQRRNRVKKDLRSYPGTIFIAAFLGLYSFSTLTQSQILLVSKFPIVEVSFVFLLIGLAITILSQIVSSHL